MFLKTDQGLVTLIVFRKVYQIWSIDTNFCTILFCLICVCTNSLIQICTSWFVHLCVSKIFFSPNFSGRSIDGRLQCSESGLLSSLSSSVYLYLSLSSRKMIYSHNPDDRVVKRKKWMILAIKHLMHSFLHVRYRILNDFPNRDSISSFIGSSHLLMSIIWHASSQLSGS